MRAIERKGAQRLSTIVIKCGGSVLNELSSSFFESIKEMKKKGFSVVIVHGGGPDINDMLKKLKIMPEFVNGLRKTTKETLQIAEMVLTGKTNRKLVEQLNDFGLKAVGLNGSDSNLIQAEYLDKERLGYVGKVQAINKDLIQLMVESGHIPVITPIAINKQNAKLNVNADYAAAAVAIGLEAEQCLFVTDVDGILVNHQVKKELNKREVNELIENGTIYGGMIPKVESALSAIDMGLKSVMIVNGKKGFFENDQWLGTQICRKEGILQ